MGITNIEFDTDFESFEKVVKKTLSGKSYQRKSDKKLSFSILLFIRYSVQKILACLLLLFFQRILT
jgi:hypothetical protein